MQLFPKIQTNRLSHLTDKLFNISHIRVEQKQTTTIQQSNQYLMDKIKSPPTKHIEKPSHSDFHHNMKEKIID